MTTSGLKTSRPTFIEYPAIDTEDIEVEVESRKLSSSSHHSAKETSKSHRKVQSLGYFKRSNFPAAREHLELAPIPGRSASGLSELPRSVASESDVASDKIDGVELLATSYSADEVLDHKF